MDSRSHTPDTGALLAEVDWVHRLARALLRDPDLAADAAQDTLLAALARPRPFFADRQRLRSWLARVTRNRAARRLRDLGRSREPLRDGRVEDRQVAEVDHGAAALTRVQTHQRVVDAVVALAEPYRSTVVMRFFDGLSTAEIAARKKAQPATIRQQLTRGLDKLRGELDRRYGSREAWCAALLGLPSRHGVWATVLTVAWSSVAMWKWFAVVSVLLAVLLWWRGVSDVPQLVAGGATGSPPGSVAAADTVAGAEQDAGSAPRRERVAAGSAGGPPPVTTVRVVRPDGTPAGDARVFRWLASGHYAEAAVDADGVGRFADDRDAVGFLAVLDGFPPRVEPAETGAREVRLALAEGHPVAGSLTVDGEVPADRIRVGLSPGSSPELDVLPQGMRRDLRDRELLPPADRWTIEVREGRFAFPGLPAGWSGQLFIDGPLSLQLRQEVVKYPVRPGHTTLFLPGPDGDLVLPLERGPELLGQVLWRDTGAAVERFRVQFEGHYENGYVRGTSAAGGRDGRFRVALQPGATLVGGSFGIRAADAVEAGRVELTAEQVESRDLGQVFVERSPTLHYRVVDGEGRPIAGAFVERSERPTDAEGRGRIPWKGERTFAVAAPGCRIARLPVIGAGTADDPAIFRLEPGNTLTVRPLDHQGRVLPAARLQVSGTGKLFIGGSLDWLPGTLHERIGGSPTGDGEVHSGRFSTVLSLAEARGDSFRFVSCKPGERLELRLLGPVGGEIAATEVLTPQPGVHDAEVVLRAPRPGRAMALRVLDGTGAPVRGASVFLRPADHLDGEGMVRSTNRRGEVRFAGLFADRADLSVECSGFVPHREAEYGIGSDTRVVTLQRGRTIRVELVDSRGRPAQRFAMTAKLEPDGPELPARYRGPGAFTIEGAPAGRVRLRVRVSHPEASFLREVEGDGLRLVVEGPADQGAGKRAPR